MQSKKIQAVLKTQTSSWAIFNMDFACLCMHSLFQQRKTNQVIRRLFIKNHTSLYKNKVTWRLKPLVSCVNQCKKEHHHIISKINHASLTLFTDECDCAVQQIFHAHSHDSRAAGSFLLITQSDEHLLWPLNPGLVEANHLLCLLTGCILTLNHLESVKKTSVEPLFVSSEILFKARHYCGLFSISNFLLSD